MSVILSVAILSTSFSSLQIDAASDPVRRGLDYLVSIQDKDGIFKPNDRRGDQFPCAVTAFCSLALLARGEERCDLAARKGLQLLAGKKRPPITRSYEYGYVALALVEGALRWKADFRPAAAKAVQWVLDNLCKHGFDSTCKTALILHVLWSARRAGLDVPDAIIQNAREFIRQLYDAENQMFMQQRGNPSYCTTGMGAAALEQWGDKDSRMVAGALSYLNSQSIKTITGNLKGRTDLPFLIMTGLHFHYDLLAHALAYLYAKDAKLLKSWLPKVRKKLVKQQAKDGSWEGWFGKPYGTALVCLILQLDAAPKLAWLQPARALKASGGRGQNMMHVLLEPPDEKAADALGGRVGREVDGKFVTRVDLGNTNTTDADLKKLQGLQKLRWLSLKRTRVTNGGLKELEPLKNLRELFLDESHVLHSGPSLTLEEYRVRSLRLKGLRQLKELRALGLGGLGVTNEDFKELGRLQDLQTLDLSRAWATDEGLRKLKPLRELRNLNFCDVGGITGVGLNEWKGLETLDLTDSSVTDVGLKKIAELEKLRELRIGETEVTDAGLKELKRLKNIEILDLHNCRRITDAALKDLKELRKLRELSLMYTGMTDAGLKELEGLVELQVLKLRGTRVTVPGAADLEKTLPKLQIQMAAAGSLGGDTVPPFLLDEEAAVQTVRRLGGDVGREAGIKSVASVNLSETKVADENLRVLRQFPRLRELNLCATRVTAAGIKELKGLKELWKLQLALTSISDAGLKELKGLKKLRWLHLNDAGGFTGEGLAELKGLEVLDLTMAVSLTDAGLRKIGELEELRELRIGETHVTDAGLKELKRLRKLEILDLHECHRLTDAALKEFKDLKSLRKLKFFDTQITSAGVADLQKALPAKLNLMKPGE